MLKRIQSLWELVSMAFMQILHCFPEERGAPRVWVFWGPVSSLVMTTTDLFGNRLLEIGIWQMDYRTLDSGHADSLLARDCG